MRLNGWIAVARMPFFYGGPANLFLSDAILVLAMGRPGSRDHETKTIEGKKRNQYYPK